jgi:hypothetical protein
MIIEKYLEVDKKVYACFIDYEKAFDRVNHEQLVRILQSIGLTEVDILIIIRLYWEQEAVVRTEAGISERINNKKSVRQGCVLSPILIFRETNGLGGISIGRQ